MKLTGKCLDAFGDQCQYNYDEFMELPESCQNALIIDFFDLVGIYISIPYLDEFGSFVGDEWCGDYTSRTEATNAAIIKANDLFNSK